MTMPLPSNIVIRNTAVPAVNDASLVALKIMAPSLAHSFLSVAGLLAMLVGAALLITLPLLMYYSWLSALDPTAFMVFGGTAPAFAGTVSRRREVWQRPTPVSRSTALWERNPETA